MRIGIFGGTFNPVHCGHVRMAEVFLREVRLGRLLVIPTHQPPHKEAPDLPSGEHRLAMCRLAFAGRDSVQVSDMEIRRGGPSFTVDTLGQIREMYPQSQPYLLVGEDMFLQFTRWERWREILPMAVLCAAARPPSRQREIERQKQLLQNAGGRCILLPLPPVDISSTALRRQLIAGKEPYTTHLPEDVFRYIREKGLYRQKKESLHHAKGKQETG